MNGCCKFGGIVLGVALGVGATVLVTTTLADPPKGGQDQVKAPQVDPMEEMLRLGAPGANHELLKVFEGRWKAKTSSTDPMTGQPDVSEGVMINSWILGGRWIRHEYKGSYAKQPFEGVGYFGYDNMKKEFIGLWMDTLSTSCMYSTGAYDPATKAWTTLGKMTGPDGKDMTMREVITVKSTDEHTMEMFMPGPDGKDFQMMSITYNRIK